MAILWLFIVLFSPCNARSTNATTTENALRHLEQRQFHRSLELYVLPFQIRWKFNISDIEIAPDDRQPTAAEYEGIAQATSEWYSNEIPLMYASAMDLFTFVGIDCDIEDTVYNPMSAEYVHEVLIGCQVIWNAANLEDTPDVNKFLLDMNADFMLTNFQPYLREADPQNPRSIFQFTGAIAYVTNNAGTRGPFDSGGTAAPTVAIPQATVPPAPSPPTAVPSTKPPSTPMPTSGLPQKKLAPPVKCGSLASSDGRGGAAAAAKDCVSRAAPTNLNDGGIRRRKKRKLKGSSY